MHFKHHFFFFFFFFFEMWKMPRAGPPPKCGIFHIFFFFDGFPNQMIKQVVSTFNWDAWPVSVSLLTNHSLMKVLLTSIPMSGGDNLFRLQFMIVFISFDAKAKCKQVKLCVNLTLLKRVSSRSLWRPCVTCA